MKIAVLLPELVVRHWWEYLLHNQRVQLLKLLLLVKGNQRIVVVNIPWYLRGGLAACDARAHGGAGAGTMRTTRKRLQLRKRSLSFPGCAVPGKDVQNWLGKEMRKIVPVLPVGGVQVRTGCCLHTFGLCPG